MILHELHDNQTCEEPIRIENFVINTIISINVSFSHQTAVLPFLVLLQIKHMSLSHKTRTIDNDFKITNNNDTMLVISFSSHKLLSFLLTRSVHCQVKVSSNNYYLNRLGLRPLGLSIRRYSARFRRIIVNYIYVVLLIFPYYRR